MYNYNIKKYCFPHIFTCIAGHCSINDLGSVVEGSPQCRLSERAAVITNGMICYTGTATGSLAYYLCDHGYELEAVKGRPENPRNCLSSEQWSGIQLECVKESTPAINSGIHTIFYSFMNEYNNYGISMV